MRATPDDLLTISQAAEASGLHPQTVREAVHRGTLPHRAIQTITVGIVRSDLDAYMLRTKGKPGRPKKPKDTTHSP
jgi:excisionase family DNA binding protein